ncbi:carbohydrate kinase [Fulvivirga sp. 29W222]|uniref:Carbohydrate kinase n=1 Tax=Fulvivirga marina TaxID=2494733 RepID=A0A937KD29_9BACT|nr:FGGY family carbohydrate kinase [Fulvivirga marina]MBL6445610.1 carbohydrate kinase [Fulvivirga marina]
MDSYLIGFDVGSSSIKAALVNADTRMIVQVTHYPEVEMGVISHFPGWAEQHPETWWENLCIASRQLLEKSGVRAEHIKSIGISYQMHGLVLLGENNEVLRPSIIWSDSRGVEIGRKAFADLGKEKCYAHLLNSPGNFTLSKLKWVLDNEPEIYNKLKKFVLPGDYIALKMTGEICTTVSGISEGVYWDFKNECVAQFLLDYFGIDRSKVADIVPTFSDQGKLLNEPAGQLGLKPGTPVSYRAGDQPNNALSLNVFNPGEIAATGGTSGVVYAVVDHPVYDKQSRINGFAHVNHTSHDPRIGLLLCINGAGSQYSWLKKEISNNGTTYEDMERMVSQVPVSSEGLRVIPFGNGAERILDNKVLGSHIINLHFNRHSRAHFYRAALEGIAFSFIYGMEILNSMGIESKVIRVGNDNLFQSGVFSTTISAITGCKIEVIETTGAAGAASASGVAIGAYATAEEALSGVKVAKVYDEADISGEYRGAYEIWKSDLEKLLL